MTTLKLLGGSQEYTAKYDELVAIYRNPLVDESTRRKYLPKLVDFHEKYGNWNQLSPEDRHKANYLYRQCKQAENQATVDGVPLQGGLFGLLFGTIAKIIMKEPDGPRNVDMWSYITNLFLGEV